LKESDVPPYFRNSLAGRRHTLHPTTAMDLAGEGITGDASVGSLAISSG
jgi:hypothetical protein